MGEPSHEWIQWTGEAPDVTSYVVGMRRSATYGGAVEIAAFCELYGATVVVFSLRSADRDKPPMTFVPRTRVPCTRVMKLTWTGNHYEPVRE